MLPQDIVAACIAVAGPVGDNTVTLTNRGWVLNGDKVGRGGKDERQMGLGEDSG